MTDIAKAFADLRAGKLKLQCSVCGTDQGGCDCWIKCRSYGCTWSYRKGTACPNCTSKVTNGERESG